MLITLAVATIKSAIKNPKRKRQLRNIMLELFQAIRDDYADDAEFE